MEQGDGGGGGAERKKKKNKNKETRHCERKQQNNTGIRLITTLDNRIFQCI